MAKFNRITQVQPSVFRKQFHAKNFAIVESGLKAAANSPRVLDRHNFKPVHPPYQIMLDPSLLNYYDFIRREGLSFAIWFDIVESAFGENIHMTVKIFANVHQLMFLYGFWY